MIAFEVISANGVVPHPPVSMQFGATGGTIGRAPHNTLVLPDVERRISRVHAQIVCRRGVIKILARSGSELLIDGQALEIGEETPLTDGARIELGGYTLRARLLQAPPETAKGPRG